MHWLCGSLQTLMHTSTSLADLARFLDSFSSPLMPLPCVTAVWGWVGGSGKHAFRAQLLSITFELGMHDLVVDGKGPCEDEVLAPLLGYSRSEP